MTSSTTTDLAEAISEAMPALDETEQRIAVTLYRALAKGRPVESAEIARHTALGLAQVEMFYDYDLLVIGAGQGGLPAAHMAVSGQQKSDTLGVRSKRHFGV